MGETSAIYIITAKGEIKARVHHVLIRGSAHVKTLQPALTAWSKIDVRLSSAQLRSKRHEGPHHPERVLKILDRYWQAGLFHRFTLGNAPMQLALFEVAFCIGRLGEFMGAVADNADHRETCVTPPEEHVH